MKYTLDLTYLLCPMPVIRFGQLAPQMKSGDTAHLICSDPGVEYDVPAWCRVHGYTIKSIHKSDEQILIDIEKP